MREGTRQACRTECRQLRRQRRQVLLHMLQLLLLLHMDRVLLLLYCQLAPGACQRARHSGARAGRGGARGMVALIGLRLLLLVGLLLLWVLVQLLLLMMILLLLLLVVVVLRLLGLGWVVLRRCQRSIPQPAAMAGGACRGGGLGVLPPGGQRVDVQMNMWPLQLLRAPLLLLLLLLPLARKALQVRNAELGGQRRRQLLLLCLRVGRQLVVVLLLLVSPARSGRCLLLLLLQRGLALGIQLWQAAQQICSRIG